MPATAPIIYFHGLPGAPDELQLFPAGKVAPANQIWAPDRNREHPGLTHSGYCDALVRDIHTRFGTGPLRLVGFSLGAFTALEMAAREDIDVVRLDLVSPAAPLELGTFLPQMAGAAIFKVAKVSPLALSLLMGMEGLLARFAPGLLFRMMFASAVGGDLALKNDPAFRAAIELILAQSLNGLARSWRREIPTYVAPWSDVLARVSCPVTLWQGCEDNWTPPAMAEALATALPQGAVLHCLSGASHYSALAEALPRLLREA